jgi:hypothetical protein
MGGKLGSMVKSLNIILVLSISMVVSTSPILEKDIDIGVLSKPLETEARVLSLRGGKDGLKLTRSVIKKPSFNVVTKYKAYTKRDKFVLKLLNQDKKTIGAIGLGNPFYIHAQHIDYEDSTQHGEYIDNQKIDVVIPLSIDVSYVVLATQDPFGLYDINEISLKDSEIHRLK